MPVLVCLSVCECTTNGSHYRGRSTLSFTHTGVIAADRCLMAAAVVVVVVLVVTLPCETMSPFLSPHFISCRHLSFARLLASVSAVVVAALAAVVL